MKFYHKNPIYLTIMVYILAVVQVIMIFITISKTFGWFGMYSLMPTLEIAQAVMSVLIIIVCAFLLSLNYRIQDRKLKIMFGFVDITRGSISIDKILNAVVKGDETADVKERGLYISVMDGGTDPIIMKINIAKDKYDEFIHQLKSVNENIISFKD